MDVDFKCGLVNGKLVCGKKQGGHNKNDDDDDDDDDRGKGKKKKDAQSELSECTIQEPGGGGGCKTGFKRVCEKMKSGKKCCGCVPDRDAAPKDVAPCRKNRGSPLLPALQPQMQWPA
ncbi:MAG: hypothetical protein ACR2J1_01955 [Methyloceanibacter sp.]|uniref:hypothetical protein n=1 Tax=Methyloceanibacter sp. TaxID=1965321 RepID=UPI003D9BA49F